MYTENSTKQSIQLLNRYNYIYIYISSKQNQWLQELPNFIFQTRTFGNLVLPEVSGGAATTGQVNVLVNAINSFGTPSC